MWLEKENDNDPYNRSGSKAPSTPSVGGGAGSGAPLGAGDGSQTISTPSTATPAKSVPAPKEATVQDYLGANKEQGNQLGQEFQTGLDTTGAKAKGTIDSSASNVKDQAAQGTVNFDSGLVDKAVSDPTKVANDPGQLQSFLKQWNASYTGPSSFESSSDYDAASKAAADAKTQGTEAADAGGRKQLLQDKFGVYGQGNKGLDQTLLQNSDSFGNVLESGKNLSSLPDYLANKATDVNAATTAAKATTDATKANTQSPFADRLTKFQGDLNSRVATDKAAATTAASQIQKDLASGDVAKIDADLKNQGVPSEEAQRIEAYLSTLNNSYQSKPDASNFYSFNPATDVNAATVATSEDYDKAKALQTLTGQDYSGVLNPADASKANTWDGSATGIKTNDLSSYFKSQMDQRDKSLVGATDAASMFGQLGLPSLMDPKNAADVDTGKKAAEVLTAAAQRQGVGAGTTQNGIYTPSSLETIYRQALDQYGSWAQPHNGGQGASDPRLAGIREFVNQLGSYLYGNTNTQFSGDAPVTPPAPQKPGK